jgi:hypothetical protein
MVICKFSFALAYELPLLCIRFALHWPLFPYCKATSIVSVLFENEKSILSVHV